MNANEANRRLGVGFQAASVLEPRLVRQYEAALRALAKRVVGRYKQLAVIAPVTAAGPPEKPEPPQPTLSEVLDAELAAESAAARTRATRRRMAKEVADALTVGFQVEPQLRGLLQALVDQQAGVQAERLVEGSRDAVAEVMLDSLVNGSTVDETAAALLGKLELDAVWRAKMLARTDLIAISNGAALASAQVLGGDGPQFKTWLSAQDDRVRPDHVEANGQVQPIGQPFQVGDSLLQYPGDPAGADDTVINCRCTLVMSDGPARILRHSNDGGNLETVLVTAAASARNVERNLSTNPGSEEDDVKNVSVTVTPDFDLAYVEGGELRIPMTASTGELAQIDAPQAADNKRYAKAFCEECGGDVDEDGNCPNCGEHDTKMAAAALTADASPLAATLVPVVAAATSMYLSAAGAHWNVTGTDFTEYHALFGEIYEDVQGSIDPLAENILKLGGRAPQNIQEMTAASPVPTVYDVREPGGFARQLADVNDGVITALTAAFAVANSLNEQGVANFLAERIDAHQKWRWQLRASLGEDASGDERLVAGGFRTEKERYEDSLTASAAGLAPLTAPAEWFEVPEADGPTALQITEDGRVFGHAATWGTCHTGIQGRCQTPPRSPSGYSYFHLGEVDTADGKRVPVGKVTLDTGHAPMAASSKATAAHYDHTGAVAAYVRARDGMHGIWVSGVLDPDLPVSKVRALKAAALSGDWRSVRGQLELIGLLAVNVPGFPIPRAQAQLVASGAEDEVEALVAAGIVCDCEPDAEAELSGLIGDTVGARELDRLIAACVPGKRRMLYGRAAKR